MEVSVMASSQVNLCNKSDFLGVKEQVGLCNSGCKKLLNLVNNVKMPCFKNSEMCVFGQWASKSLSIKASATAQTHEAVVSEKAFSGIKRSKPIDGVKLYVGLPLDAVSDSGKINHERAITTGLKALKLLGVEGVELPIWWGTVEKEAAGKYDWTGYLALAEIVEKLGLKLQISLCFHASEEAKIPLPQWVSQIGESNPNIFFKDRSGQHYKGCLSFAVDDLPVLNGKTPIQVYKDFCENFKASFLPLMSSTVTNVSIGLGPDGELRYPSNHNSVTSNCHHGAGEFQCYDENICNQLKQHAETHGNPLWGLSGPHDVPSYNEPPFSNNFFKEHGGSWETAYGDFFLSWYSGQLLSHGDRLLSLASSTFSDAPITVSGKVPLMHAWYKTRTHPAELTAGFYNTVNRDGYEAIAEMFSKNSSHIILPGMDLSDEYQPAQSLSSPELLLAQIASSCRKHGVKVSGQNSLVSGGSRGFDQIKKNILGENARIGSFMYQRMGAEFFSPEHFPSFTKLVRDLNQPDLHSDDLPVEEEETTESISDKSLRMQTA